MGIFDNSMSVLCGFGIQVHLFYKCGWLGAGEQKPRIQSKRLKGGKGRWG
jgi:hypothetical protein